MRCANMSPTRGNDASANTLRPPPWPGPFAGGQPWRSFRSSGRFSLRGAGKDTGSRHRRAGGPAGGRPVGLRSGSGPPAAGRSRGKEAKRPVRTLAGPPGRPRLIRRGAVRGAAHRCDWAVRAALSPPGVTVSASPNTSDDLLTHCKAITYIF